MLGLRCLARRLVFGSRSCGQRCAGVNGTGVLALELLDALLRGSLDRDVHVQCLDIVLAGLLQVCAKRARDAKSLGTGAGGMTHRRAASPRAATRRTLRRARAPSPCAIRAPWSARRPRAPAHRAAPAGPAPPSPLQRAALGSPWRRAARRRARAFAAIFGRRSQPAEHRSARLCLPDARSIDGCKRLQACRLTVVALRI